MNITLSVEQVREMLNEASRFNSDIHILADVEKAVNETDPKKKAQLEEAIVRKATYWAPREFQPSQREKLFELSRAAIVLRAMENVRDFQSKFGIEIKGLPWA